jgi:drug/metabolite transporter (DMT)-like permease
MVTEVWTWLGAVAYTAVFSLAMGYTLQIWAQRHTPPSDAALILSLESVFAAISGWIVLGERLTPVQVLGAGLIFLAVLVSQWPMLQMHLNLTKHTAEEQYDVARDP